MSKQAKHNAIRTIRPGQVLGYMFLPQIFPRFRSFTASGFGYLAFLIARVYLAVRIFPDTHAYCQPENIGRFGIRDVIAAAANHIPFNRGNIDKIIVFLAVLTGIVILFLQFLALLTALVTKAAWAAAAQGPGPSLSLFHTARPENDLAFMLLDRVFGLPNFFGSRVNAEIPTSFHDGLHGMFAFYNTALLIVAGFIFLYFVLVVVAETAQSGTPFGRRFSHVYAPFRLVIAIGLLVPLAHGLNASQYIALYAAKMGSGFATNGWLAYIQDQSNPLGGENKELLAKPAPPSMNSVAAFMAIAHTCRAAYDYLEFAADEKGQRSSSVKIQAYLIKGDQSSEPLINGSHTLFPDKSYQQARDFYNFPNSDVGGDIIIRFGEKNEQVHKKYKGFVRPYCGELLIPVRVRNDPRLMPDQVGQEGLIGPEYIQEGYYDYSLALWYDDKLRAFGERMVVGEKARCSGNEFGSGVAGPCKCHKSSIIGDQGSCKTTKNKFPPGDEFAQDTFDFVNAGIMARIDEAYEDMVAGMDLSISDELVSLGWGGAGLWYNQVADVNGSFFSAVRNVPSPRKMPEIMEFVAKKKAEANEFLSFENRYLPQLADEKPIDMSGTERKIAIILNDTYEFWNNRDKGSLTGNIFYDAINMFLGTYGLFDLRSEEALSTHPLALLVGIGRGMVESAVRNLAFSMGAATGGSFIGGLGALEEHIGASISAMSTFFVSLATIDLAAGFVLFYVVPFLPFIYFYFAVAGWVKAVFEAMVGAPLWALAHLRIEGDGLPGRAAQDGYFLILEILIRPLLTVFGLIGGMAIFTSLVVIMHEVFDLVIANMSGYASEGYQGYMQGNISGPAAVDSDKIIFKRATVDEFFFTIVYTILIYMMGVSSFKMIDMVPNQILRWMGAGVPSFGDQRSDPTQGLVQYAALGGATVGGQLAQGMSQAGQAIGTGGAGIVDAAKKMQEQPPPKK